MYRIPVVDNFYIDNGSAVGFYLPSDPAEKSQVEVSASTIRMARNTKLITANITSKEINPHQTLFMAGYTMDLASGTYLITSRRLNL
jgi:hypothetical protein